VHNYLDDGTLYEQVHALYPDKPMVVSECGGPEYGAAGYGERLAAWIDGLPDYVRWAAPFVWQHTAPYAEWALEDTDASEALSR